MVVVMDKAKIVDDDDDGDESNSLIKPLMSLAAVLPIYPGDEILSQTSNFGSVSALGAMVGAITSGSIADFIGRKRVIDIWIHGSVVGNVITQL
ncbi:hypothetical protein C5167_016446 [Papaver somniferum]|nr:hypothetical protein C5167_016446 [Papaver somniferum]